MEPVRVRVEQTPLPGIGVRHDLVTSSGRTVGVVSHRNGRRDLVLYDVDDPDACLASIPLTDDEAARLEASYTPRLDHQGVSDPAMLRRAAETATGHSISRLPVRELSKAT